jgi:hypothetical protein
MAYACDTRSGVETFPHPSLREVGQWPMRVTGAYGLREGQRTPNGQLDVLIPVFIEAEKIGHCMAAGG